MSASPSRVALILAFAAIYLIWGTTYLGIRVAVETMPPFLMSGVRFVVAGAALLAFLKLRGTAWPSRAQWRDQAIIGACLLAGGNGVVAWAEQTVPSGLTTLILGASPLIMVLMEWLRPGGVRPTPMLWLGFAVGLCGLLVLLGPGALPADVRPPASSLLALFFASISWWGGSLFAKYTKSGAAPIMAATLQMLCGGGLMLLIGLLAGEGPRVDVPAISGRSWLAWSYLVVAGSLVAFPVYAWLLKNSTPAKVSTYSYVNPVVAVILGWAILDEPLTPHIALAAGIIIGAVAIITVQKNRLKPA
ncbi:MAG: EamA family transporter [Opitutaceae bacterium]|nr:EamA family transporter [Opitutaceae bacterium]